MRDDIEIDRLFEKWLDVQKTRATYVFLVEEEKIIMYLFFTHLSFFCLKDTKPTNVGKCNYEICFSLFVNWSSFDFVACTK